MYLHTWNGDQTCGYGSIYLLQGETPVCAQFCADITMTVSVSMLYVSSCCSVIMVAGKLEHLWEYHCCHQSAGVGACWCQWLVYATLFPVGQYDTIIFSHTLWCIQVYLVNIDMYYTPMTGMWLSPCLFSCPWSLSLSPHLLVSFLPSVQLRIFRLARWWYWFNMFLDIMWTLTFLPLIGFFTFVVVGMQLFQKDYNDSVCRIAEDCTLPRWHMGDSFHTFLLIFRIFNGSWIKNLWDCMEVSGQGLCLTFFIVVVVIGNLLVSLRS